MKRVHIVGRKNHGKTTLIVDLIQACRQEGMRVGSIKHSHHRHELDVPGKDSHRHRMAGAQTVAVISPALTALFLPTPGARDNTDRYSAILCHFAACDLVLVEGDSQTDAPKIEVSRADLGTTPLAVDTRGIVAVVTDAPWELPQVALPRRDVPGIVRWIAENIPSRD